MNQSIITCIFFFHRWLSQRQHTLCLLDPEDIIPERYLCIKSGWKSRHCQCLCVRRIPGWYSCAHFWKPFKGFFPVALALRTLDIDTPYVIPILIAPVLGHAFPLQFSRKTVTKKAAKPLPSPLVYCLESFPVVTPVYFPCSCLYSFFCGLDSTGPHLFRSIITFGVFCLLVFLFVPVLSIDFALPGIALLVIYKHLCAYQNEKLSIRFFFQK